MDFTTTSHQEIRVFSQQEFNQLSRKLTNSREMINLILFFCLYEAPLTISKTELRNINMKLKGKNIDKILVAINQVQDIEVMECLYGLKFNEFTFMIKKCKKNVLWGSSECTTFFNKLANIPCKQLKVGYDLEALDKSYHDTFWKKIENTKNIETAHIALITQKDNDFEQGGLDKFRSLDKICIFSKVVFQIVDITMKKSFMLKLALLSIKLVRLHLAGKYIDLGLKVLAKYYSKEVSLGFSKETLVEKALPLFCIDIGQRKRHIDLYQISATKMSKSAFKVILKTKQVLNQRLLASDGKFISPKLNIDEITFLRKHDYIA